MAAAQRGRDEVLQLLLEKRASIDMQDAKGWTALMHATQAQRPKIVSELLGANASVHVAATEDGQRTALMLAAVGARSELCTLLLKAGAPKEARDASGWKAVHFAARQGNGGALVSLIASRARVNDQTSAGLSPLLVAATSGRSECVKILLANLADPTAKDDEGRSAVDIARVHDHERVLAVLANAGG
jgi:ankyrin repeat protein